MNIKCTEHINKQLLIEYCGWSRVFFVLSFITALLKASIKRTEVDLIPATSKGKNNVFTLETNKHYVAWRVEIRKTTEPSSITRLYQATK